MPRAFGEGDDFAEGLGDDGADLGHRAPDADRHAGERADAAHRGDEEELRPHAAVDVRRDLDVDVRLRERLPQSFDALGARVVELPEHDHRLGRGVADVPGSTMKLTMRAEAAQRRARGRRSV